MLPSKKEVLFSTSLPKGDPSRILACVKEAASWNAKISLAYCYSGSPWDQVAAWLRFQASSFLKLLCVRYQWDLDLDTFGMPLVSVVLCREAEGELQGVQSPAWGHTLAYNYVQSCQIKLLVDMHGRSSFVLTLTIQDCPFCWVPNPTTLNMPFLYWLGEEGTRERAVSCMSDSCIKSCIYWQIMKSPSSVHIT